MSSLSGQIEEIRSCELGIDLQLPSGQSHPAGKNRSVCWSASFDGVEGYSTYESHPAHLRVLNDLIKPVILPGSRAAIQYNV